MVFTEFRTHSPMGELQVGKDKPFNFGLLNKIEIKALETQQRRLLSPLILARPSPNGCYTLEIDDCEKKIGCVLLQEQLKQPAKPLGYWSRSPDRAEQAYDKRHGRVGSLQRRMGRPTAETFSQRVTMYFLNRPRCAAVTIEHDGCD